MKYRTIILIHLFFFISAVIEAQTYKALFDNTKNETAGNADWIIDTDQPIPVPDQSGITTSTPESYWLGAISAWGVDLVKRGFTVHTLTTSYGITYGNTSNPYDLSNYNLFIVCEPQGPFSASEKLAIKSFVQNGGGLMMVADHNASDRNGDGWDSPMVWNDLRTDSLFGIHFQSTGETDNNITAVYTNVETGTDTIINGPAGIVSALSYHNGTSMRLTSSNPNAKGHIWVNGIAHGTTQIVAATSRYGLGKVAGVGDSSPADDGSAQPGNQNIYNGWKEVGATDDILFLNMCMWLVTKEQTPPPAQVNLVFPSDLSTGISIPTTFKWRQTSTATNYQFDLSTSNTFSPFTVSDSTLVDTMTTIPDLSRNTTYYWRVKAKNAAGWSSFSSIRSFSTWDIPPQVILDFPSDSSRDLLLPTNFSWHKIQNVIKYNIEIADDYLFSTVTLQDSTLTDSAITLSNLSGGNHYWHVQAQNSAGWGSFSAIRLFSVVVPPTKVILLDPPDGSNGLSDTITFRWQKSNPGTNYYFELSKSSAFDTLVISDSTIIDTSFRLTGLDSNAVYYWRVTAKNLAGWGPHSDVWSFSKVRQQIITYHFNQGWNLISTSLKGDSNLVKKLFPTAVSNAFMYNNGYTIAESLFTGKGYWLKFDSAETITITGMLSSCDSILLNAGWNLIGALSFPFDVVNIKIEPYSTTLSPFYRFETNYISTNTLYPLTGYWVKASQQCKLLFR